MGLDMYLRGKLYLSEYSHPEALEALEKVELPGVTVPPQYIQNFRSRTMTVPLMYWRKANQIHAWFVREVQDGVDECQNAYVPIEKLQELHVICGRVLEGGEEVAKVLLPVQSGFFFGRYEYDSYYFDDVRETKEALGKLLADYDAGLLKGWEFQYQSSW